MKKTAYILLVVLFFAALGWWKFEPALTRHMASVGQGHGDSIGTMSLIFTVSQEAREKGIEFLAGDLMDNGKVGYGLSPPLPMSVFWKTVYAGLSRFLDWDQVYDASLLGAFVLIGLSGFLLLRAMGVSALMSVAGGLLLVSLEHFTRRAAGHHSLACYFGPVLACASAVWAGKRPSPWRMFLFALALVLNFNANEYYGYFGLVFAYPLFAAYLAAHARGALARPWRTACGLALHGAVLAGLLFLLYPHLIFAKVAAALGQGGESVAAVNISHTLGEFSYYGVKNVLEALAPGMAWLRSLVPMDALGGNHPEFTFRVGLVLPLTALAGCVAAGAGLAKSGNEPARRIVSACLCWAPALVLIILFSLSTDSPWSLAWITYKAASMFRVSARAWVYVDIGLVTLFITVLDNAFAWALSRAPERTRPWAALVLAAPVCLLLWFGLRDVSKEQWNARMAVHALPGPGVYQALAGRPVGHLIEIPFHSPASDLPESIYMYCYNRNFHGMPLSNVPYLDPGATAQILHDKCAKFNLLNKRTIREFQKAGIRYLSVDKAQVKDHAKLKDYDLLTLVGESPEKVIYEIKPLPEEERVGFVDFFVKRQLNLRFANGFYGPEGNPATYWRWCRRTGTMVVQNLLEKTRRVRFTARFYSASGSTLVVSTPFFKDAVHFDQGNYKPYAATFTLSPKSFINLDFASNAPPLEVKGEERELVFSMYDYEVYDLED